jgi:antitoxin CptB
MVSDAIDLKKMYWHSRRGMLELDLILVPFAENVLPQLSKNECKEYARLLEEEDQDIFMWLMKRVPVQDSSLQPIVDKILSHT